MPPIGNVFWSEAAQGEWQLRAARPRELPPVLGRDDEVCRELEQPVADGDRDNGKRGRDLAGIRMSGPEFSTPASWQGVGQNERMRTPARDEHGLGDGQKSSGTMPQETPEASGVKTEGPHPAAEEVPDAFQRALEREMVEKLQEDNRKLQRELQDLKMQRDLENNSGLELSWSDASSRPQPPPPEEENEPQRFTPNGTKVPKGPPPNFDKRVPSWPLGPYEQSAVDRVWKQLGLTAVLVGEAARLHDGRVGHGASSRQVRDHPIVVQDTGLDPDKIQNIVVVEMEAGLRDPDMMLPKKKLVSRAHKLC